MARLANDAEGQAEAEFLSIVASIAARFDCTIVKVDFRTRTVYLDCPAGKAQEVKCAHALADVLTEQRT